MKLETVKSPKPGDAEARVAVHACGVNFADTLLIAGNYQVRPEFPFSPGLEIAGEVLEVGQSVHGIKPGDRVLGITNYGGFAEEIALNAALLVPLPEEMDYITAAAFPIAYGTSHLALTHRARLQPGEVLLVLGAAGGVGLTAVELGHLLGATVIAAASTAEKLELTEEYGASYTINYTEEDLQERVMKITGDRGADVIFDPVGGERFEAALRCLSWEGRLLVIGFTSGDIPEVAVNQLLLKNTSLVGLYWGAYSTHDPELMGDSLTTLLDWHESGTLKPHISATYPLEKAADALNAIIERKSTGKTVLVTKHGR